MTERQGDIPDEFDIKWAEQGPKEPSARARMLAARWKDNPPGPQPFRADPDPGVRPARFTDSGYRRSWASVAIVAAGLVLVLAAFALLTG
ncbi:SCO2583/SCO2584 N-terminal domain-containing protein [Streptomyces halobius]|uniref:DUF3040 family protein n=1 Tax=Streptomyces halobius TaxID=2879846 RepID=A0ABY4M457_9ACTN|nr:hypothetical protein [Streptomyces halobius]UQA92547.1 hypothetical protein K9S39_12585 [Streptomyces halobius]